MTGKNDIHSRAEEVGLSVLGGLHPSADVPAPAGVGTILLLGPDEPRFWDIFTRSPEALDGEPNPMDRWSERVVTDLAREHAATPAFPFGGPPWHPFVAWATATGRIFASPVSLLVHGERGLMVSFRGALMFRDRLPVPPALEKPCDTCAGKWCLDACPPRALTQERYDVATCKAHVREASGRACMDGCLVRRACPVGQGLRPAAQSRFHMKAFARP